MKIQKKNNGKRYCKECGNSLQKWGKNRGGSQRWFCKICKISNTEKRPEQSIISQINTFLDWALSKKIIMETADGICRKTFYNRVQKILQIEPAISKTGELYNCLLVDSTCIKNRCLMILKTPQAVVDFHWAESENKY